MRISLKLLSLLLLAIPINCQATMEINLTRSPVAVLGLHLENASSNQRLDFAQIALTQLYESYETAVNRSYGEKPSKSIKRMKIGRWRYATNSYLQQIGYVLDQIASGRNFDFFINPQDVIVFSIPGEMVMVTGPNQRADRLIEKNIIDQFCGLYDCNEYFSSDGEQYIKGLIAPVNGRWIMSGMGGADFYTDSGIAFRFAGLADRKAKEEWSISLARELLLLVNAIEAIHVKGHLVDFGVASISRDSTKDGLVKLTINGQGDFAELALPELSKNTEIFLIVKPWLKNYQRKELKTTAVTIVPSENYFSKL